MENFLCKNVRRDQTLSIIIVFLLSLLQIQGKVFAIDTPIASLALSAFDQKFGDRVLPLRKKNLTILATTEKSINNLLRKSNDVSKRGKVRATKSDLVNELANEWDRNRERYLISTNNESTVFEMLSKSRQPKQLIRREDSIVETALESSHENASKADRLEMSTEFFIVPTVSIPTMKSKNSQRSKTDSRGSSNTHSILVRTKTHLDSNMTNFSTLPPIISTYPKLFQGLRNEPWVVPVLILSVLLLLAIFAFEIFVLFKAWRTSPSRRHLFLGQMLLLGLFSCASFGAVMCAQPSLLSCGSIQFGVGVAYALVFAALLVKCVFLISLNGGVYLPAPYQGLLLLFAVLIQIVIGTQWILTQPPDIYSSSVPVIGSNILSSTVASQTNYTSFFFPTAYSTPNSPEVYTRIAAVSRILIPLCKTKFSELLFSLIYIAFLIVFISVLAIKSRGIRENYREATYIGLAIGVTIPIWLAWAICGTLVADRHKDACIAFGLLATSATVFLVMFMPKGRQLAAMGKEGLYIEDREEQFSSLSRAGSGYSPSFFHFKPLKYGGIHTTTANAGNSVNLKHCANVNNGGGIFMRSDESNFYTTLEPTLSSNPNVYFQPGMMY